MAEILSRRSGVSILKGVQRWLAPTPRSLRHPRVYVWFCLALVYSAVVAVLGWNKIAGDPYALADDARQHVVWMLRFTDPDLFVNDWIADYYQSVSPIGYVLIYRLFAVVGVSPLLLCKLLPPVLIVLTGAIAFLTVLEFSALPAAGFVTAALLTQSVEYTGTLASGTSKAFIYLVMLLFIYGWLRRSRGLTWGAIALQGILYPQAVLLTAGVLVLGLVEQREGRWSWARDRHRRQITLGGLLIATTVILYYGLSTSQFGPTMTRAQALMMPEFFAGGRASFFKPSWLEGLLYGRGGLRLDTATTPVTNLLALGLPLMLRWPRPFPLVKSVTRDLDLLLKLLLTAFFWFFAAHIVLFKLYLPSRYTGRFLLMVGVIAAGIVVVILADACLNWAIALLTPPRSSPVSLGFAALALGFTIILGLGVVLYPLTMQNYPSTSMSQGYAPDLYGVLAQQPKDSLIAGLSVETSNIPSYAQRSVLLSQEIAIPYHVGYYAEISQRARDLIRAQYSADPQVVSDFITQYGVTHWLLEPLSFDIHTLNRDRWIQQYQPEAGQAVSALANGNIPALQTLGDRCVAYQTAQYTLLQTDCVVQALESL
ncbi:MAG: hypothetical protein ACFBSG_19920 [Leptolyngbyaceae cyanobacterium]